MRRNLEPVFSEKFSESIDESVAAINKKFKDAIITEIEKHSKSVRVLSNAYNTEFALIKELMSKSIVEKIDEVREEERKKCK